MASPLCTLFDLELVKKEKTLLICNTIFWHAIWLYMIKED
jgi:hypothetical protein